jgi:hypothetical protein
MTAYHARIQTQLNATRRPSDLSIGDPVYAHETDLREANLPLLGEDHTLSLA